MLSTQLAAEASTEGSHAPSASGGERAAVSSRPMFVLGANYPWVSCGHDFGPKPPAWAGAGRTDWKTVRRDFEELAELGLSVVRYWLLAGGVNYPVGRDPDEYALRIPFRELGAERTTALRFEPWGAPPALPRAFLDDFECLLEACRAAGVRLLPSLISFELFLPITPHVGGPASGGRGAFVLGRHQRAFFDGVLEPLLDVCERHRDALFAFEVMNEPDWVALPAEGERPLAPTDALAAFLVEGARRIARRGLLSTIGFCHARPSWLPEQARFALAALASRGRYLHQRHHYPREDLSMRLPPASTSAVEPCLLGELPTAQHARWADPELWASECEPERYLEARIALAKERGYVGALVWACRANDPHSRWDARVRAQVKRAVE